MDLKEVAEMHSRNLAGSWRLILDQISPTAAVRRELSLLFSYSSTYADYLESLDLLGRGAIDPGPLLSKYALKDAPEAFEAVGKGRTVKAILVP